MWYAYESIGHLRINEVNHLNTRKLDIKTLKPEVNY